MTHRHSLGPVVLHVGRTEAVANPRRLRWVGRAYLAMSAVLLPWIIYLHRTLPIHETASHYRLAWVGFDIALGGQLAYIGVCALRLDRSAGLRAHAAACAAQLVTDAWFDVTTSPSNQLPVSLAMAVFVELPLAYVCWWLATRARDLPRPEGAPRERPERLLENEG